MTNTLREVIARMNGMLEYIHLNIFALNEEVHGRWYFETEDEDDMKTLATLLNRLDATPKNECVEVKNIIIEQKSEKTFNLTATIST